MGKALEDSIKHWKSIIRKIQKHHMIESQEYKGKSCPLCHAYYDNTEPHDYTCWACPLAYHRWKTESYPWSDLDAFDGSCAEEWTAFADSLGFTVEEHGKSYRLPIVQEVTVNKAKEMLEVLKHLDESKRFTDRDDFEREFERELSD